MDSKNILKKSLKSNTAALWQKNQSAKIYPQGICVDLWLKILFIPSKKYVPSTGPFMPQIIHSPSPILNSKFYILNSLNRQFIPEGFIPKGSSIPAIPFAQLNSAFNI